MKSTLFDRASVTLRDFVLRAQRCEQGVAAIEFAMIVPIMFALFIGSVEMSQAITVDRRVTQIASSAADLASQDKTINDAQLQNIMDISKVLMRPFDTTKLKVTVFNVGANINDASVTKVCWSYNYNGGANTYVKGASYTLPDPKLVDKGTSVVIAEVKYAYTPLIFAYYMPGLTNLTDKFYLKPRESGMIKFNNDTPCLP
jgi:Flp pilus assembly protein TadG